jgi:hypothetical protein
MPEIPVWFKFSFFVSFDILKHSQDTDLELWQPHALDPAKPRYHPVPARVIECFKVSSSLGVFQPI